MTPVVTTSVRSKLKSEKLKLSANLKLDWDRMLSPSIFWQDILQIVWCPLWQRNGGTAQAKMKLDMPLVQALFSRAVIHLVQLLMRLSSRKLLSFLKALRNSEQQENEPHFQLFLSQVIFCTLLQEFQKGRPLLYVTSNWLKMYWFYDFLSEKCKQYCILSQCLSVTFRTSGLELKGNTAATRRANLWLILQI